MKSLFRKTMLASVVVATMGLSAAASAATVFPDFTVNEGSISGAISRTLTADKITGNYVEIITFSGAASGTFNVSLKWNAGQFVGEDGSQVRDTQLGGISPNQYRIYALYNGSGTYDTTASGTVFNFTPGGSLQLFSDANSDTVLTKPVSGADGFTATNNGDDFLLAFGVPVSGEGTLDPTLSTCGSNSNSGTKGINCGSFGASSTISLTPEGSRYFIEPNPFYNIAFQSGQLNNFQVSGTQEINGSLDVVFGNVVPEPTSVALLGLGLFGLAASRRNAKKK